MINQEWLQDLFNKTAELIPDDAKDLGKDFEKNFKAILQSSLAKMNLVTREEFDAQQAVLQRSREKIEQMEQQLEILESRLKEQYNDDSQKA